MAAAKKTPVTITSAGPLNGALSGVLTWVDARFPLVKMWEEQWGKYVAPKNFNFWYYFGSLSAFVLVLQIATGIFYGMPMPVQPLKAMAAIANGMAYDGLFRPSIATFLVFADYSRPSMRIAALSKLPVIYIYTHDSIGVGEDGPTHQPVETISSLRLIPNLDVIRPADPEETAGAYAAALERADGPTLIALSRQAVPVLNEIPPHVRRAGVLKGGYVAVQETAPLTHLLLSTGSELHLALAAAKELGAGTRVVSLPSFERFERQTAEYRDSIIPPSCRARVAVEAGVTGLWRKYVGLDGKVVGIDRFGISAPAPQVYKELGITAEAVVAAARSL